MCNTKLKRSSPILGAHSQNDTTDQKVCPATAKVVLAPIQTGSGQIISSPVHQASRSKPLDSANMLTVVPEAPS